MKLKKIIQESAYLGELPSSKLMKMKWNPVTEDHVPGHDPEDDVADQDHKGDVDDLPPQDMALDTETEGFASDAQRRAAFASGYKAKGKKKKKNEDISLTGIKNEAAPRMKVAKETENIKKVYMALSGLKKAGGSGRYGKEFDSAKKKALKAMNDMLTYSRIGG